MAKKELGRIRKPSVASYDKPKKQRRLYVVPLLVGGDPAAHECYEAKLQEYWSQVDAQLMSLQEKLGSAHKIYCEFLVGTPMQMLQTLAQLSAPLHKIVDRLIAGRADLENIEDEELLHQYFDWMQCRALQLRSSQAQEAIMKLFVDVVHQREKVLISALQERLHRGETAIVFTTMRELSSQLHGVEVFRIMPPAIDEIRHLLSNMPDGSTATTKDDAPPQGQA